MYLSSYLQHPPPDSFALAVDTAGHSTLVGWTYSTDLPTIRSLQASYAGPTGGQDLLVATLKPDGSAAHLVSYLGSSDERAWDVARAVSGSGRRRTANGKRSAA